MLNNPHIKINHPMADAISVQDSPYHMCRPGRSSEIAFFKDGTFVCEPLPEFAEYHDGSYFDTAVYGYVPNEMIETFLVECRA